MTLSSALEIGRSALLASRAAIEVAGNNLANMATEGYHRQSVVLEPTGVIQLAPDFSITGSVQISEIVREVDSALESRLRASLSDQASSQAVKDLLMQIESLEHEFTDFDLSSHLGAFFGAWSELANNPGDASQRNIVVQQAKGLAAFARDLRQNLSELLLQTDQQIAQAVRSADDLLNRIDALNEEIVFAEQNGDIAAGLRDQRGILLSRLSQFLDISTNELSSGAVDVYVGSLPIILNGQTRGIELRQETVDDQVQIKVVIRDDQSELTISSGRIGALVSGREDEVNGAIRGLDDFANNLIFEVNRIHSQGQGTGGMESVTSTTKLADAAVALNDPAAGLKFNVTHGSFQIHLTTRSAGQRISTMVHVDLDGIDPASDTSLSSLAAAIDAIDNISATITSDRRLRITTGSSDLQLTFSDDTSGVLAALGINTFFTGANAKDIALNPMVDRSPAHIAVSQGHVQGDNSGALAIAALRDQGLSSLDGRSLTQLWNRHVEDFAVRLAQGNQQFDADTLVVENLKAQQQAISGVNADEEVINLLTYQRAYQGAARFLAVVDELFETLIQLL